MNEPNAATPDLFASTPSKTLSPFAQRSRQEYREGSAAMGVSYVVPSDFWEWLDQNAELYRTFERMADRVRKKRPFYSARTIIEVMRWETDVAEIPQGEFKIGNNHVPHMARLYNAQRRVLFFSTRRR